MTGKQELELLSLYGHELFTTFHEKSVLSIDNIMREK
jgi:hypothetical protein